MYRMAWILNYAGHREGSQAPLPDVAKDNTYQIRSCRLPSHAAAVAADSPLYRCLECGRILVNSCHHQAVKTFAPGLTPMAMAPDGIIEALYMPSHPFLWAVQWHPEFSLRRDENSRKIFAAFVSAAAGRSE